MSDYNLMWNEAEYLTEARSTNEVTEAPPLAPPARVSERAVDVAASPTENVQSSATVWRPGVERRKRKRAQVKMPAAVRSSQSIRDSFREVVTTENASRAGLCFRSNAGHYQLGMKLRVTFPYSSHSDDVSNENPGDVVRLETLADGGFRIAVAFHPPSYTAPSNYSAKAERPATERREHKRCELSARVVLREEKSETVMNARCSELSLGGCYIDTLNPFHVGTRVKLEIQKDERVFTTYASVCSSHCGSGMGLSFHDLTPELTSLLFNWLL